MCIYKNDLMWINNSLLSLLYTYCVYKYINIKYKILYRYQVTIILLFINYHFQKCYLKI